MNVTLWSESTNRWWVRKAITPLIGLLILVLATSVWAKGKPQPDPPPQGLVFYDYWEDGVTVGYAVDADGDTPVVGVPGTPSYELHDGSRWFLQWAEGSGTGRELYAVRDDHTSVHLPIDSSLFIPSELPVWVPGSADAEVSFVGMDINTKESSVFKLGLDFSTGTPTSTTLSSAWSVPTAQWGEEPDQWWTPDAGRHSWSDNGNLLVYAGDSPAHAGIHLVNLSAGTETTVAQGTGPSISPDGTAIAFTSPDYDLALVNTNGTDERVLATSKHRGDKDTMHFSPYWSPDSQDLIWQKLERHLRWNIRETDILRIGRDGGNATNITRWVEHDPSGGPTPWVHPRGWRSDPVTGDFLSVPEPTCVSLLVMGSCGFAGYFRRRLLRNQCKADSTPDECARRSKTEAI